MRVIRYQLKIKESKIGSRVVNEFSLGTFDSLGLAIDYANQWFELHRNFYPRLITIKAVFQDVSTK